MKLIVIHSWYGANIERQKRLTWHDIQLWQTSSTDYRWCDAWKT